MSLWGNKENRSLTGTVAVTTGSAVVTGTGTQFLTELKVGWVVNVGSQRFVVKSIASNTQFTAETNSTASASGQAATVTEVPVYLSVSEKRMVYGVDRTEATVTKGVHPGWVKVTERGGSVKSLTITEPGTGYKTAPTVTISGGTYTTQATATATIANGKVVALTVTNPGMYSGNTSPTVTVAGEEYSFNTGTGVNSTNETITLTGHTFVTGDKVRYSKNSGTVNIGLAEATDYYVIYVDANTIKLATTPANAQGNVPVNLTASGAETHKILGTVATATVTMSGGFGRKKRETLVSMSVPAATMGDRENVEFPNS
ncbi:MAG: hypothetical protein N3A54_00565 [Patescibacteria group bacterium]|nr:hypothetical protein [Patescibacteria group bacterium]